MTNLDYEKMGKLIEKLRNDLGMTVAELANVMGVSNASVTQWEKGKKRCSVENLGKLAEFFNVSIEEIIEGKLHNEGTLDYLKRNFDLEHFNVDELIKNKKVNCLYEYLSRCVSIKWRYWELLPRWSRNELSEGEAEEFNFIKQYFWLDKKVMNCKYETQYFHDSNNGVEDSSLKECVRGYFESLEYLPKEAHEWEISKLIGYKFNIKPIEVIKLGDTDCIGLMLNLCNQQYKDELVALNIKGKTSLDLTDNKSICNLIWNGGNCVYRFIEFAPVIWDDELLEYIEGEIVEDKERTNAWEYCIRPGYNFNGNPQIYDYVDEWKTMSYAEYQKTIMEKKTRYINDLGSIKYSNPQLFYRKLLSGEYDTYLQSETTNLFEAFYNL